MKSCKLIFFFSVAESAMNFNKKWHMKHGQYKTDHTLRKMLHA